MRIAIIAVGKVKQAGLRAELDDYLGRLRRYVATDEIELRDGPQREQVARFDKALPTRCRVVALEVAGDTVDSQGLALLIERARQEAVGTLAFLIGGADGLPPEVAGRADLRLSLSALTLPHRLARLVLAEQLYRGFTILRGEPYNH